MNCFLEVKLNFYMQGQAGPYQCGQAMKIGLNTLFLCRKIKEDSGLFYWQECNAHTRWPFLAIEAGR